MTVGHGSRAVIAWGETPPIWSVGFDPPFGEGDSGYTVLFADSADPADLPPDDGEGLPDGITVICLHCLIDDFPEVGRGLDLAREFGSADLRDGVWVGRRLEPLDSRR